MAIKAWMRRPARRLLAAASLALALSGRPAQAYIRPATVPEPLGAAVDRIFKIQANLAYADHFVFYECEWVGTSAELAPYGKFHVAEVIRRWATTDAPVVIEINLNDAINQKRRLALVNAFAKAGVPDPDRRVVVGFSRAEGLYGDEAVMLYPQLIMIRFRMMGRGGMGGFGGMGGMGGMFGGFGMGGFGGFGMGGFGGGFGGWGGLGGMGLGGLGGGSYGGTVQGYRGLGY